MGGVWHCFTHLLTLHILLSYRGDIGLTTWAEPASGRLRSSCLGECRSGRFAGVRWAAHVGPGEVPKFQCSSEAFYFLSQKYHNSSWWWLVNHYIRIIYHYIKVYSVYSYSISVWVVLFKPPKWWSNGGESLSFLNRSLCHSPSIEVRPMLNDNIVESVLLLSLNRFVCLILMVIFSHFPIFSHLFPYFPIFSNVLPLQSAIFWVSHGIS